MAIIIESQEHPTASGAGRRGWGDVRPAVVALIVLLTVDVLVLLLELANRASGYFFPLLLLEAEGNVPTWVLTVQLYTAGLGALVLGWSTRGTGRLAWWVIALSFAFLSLDDATGLHERISENLGAGAGSGIWAVVYLPPALLALVAFLYAARDLMLRFPPARLLLLAGVGLGFLTVVLDAVFLAGADTSLSLTQVGIVSEEIIELFAASLFVGAVLTAVNASVNVTNVDRSGRESGPTP